MQKLLLLFVIAFSLSAISQTSTSARLPGFFKNNSQTGAQKMATIINLKDSTYNWSWDVSFSIWGPPNRTIYSYNSVYKENGFVNSNWSGSVWYDNSRNVNYTFDSNNNLLGNTSQFWNGTAWQNSNKLTNTFDASNNLINDLNQSWNNTTSAWVNSYKDTYTFDSNHNMLTALGQTWNTGTSSWVNSYSATATFNANNEYTSYSSQTWNTTTNSWKNDAKAINLVYSNGDFISYEWQTWNSLNLTYENSFKLISGYDSNHHILLQTMQTWDNTSGSWVNSSKTNFTYDSNGNQITMLSQNWDVSASAWVNSYRQNDYYTSFVGIKELSTQTNIMAYPNPFAGELIIESPAGELSADYILSDELGRVAFKGVTNGNRTTINTSYLEKGFYTLTLTNDKGIVKSLKLIK